MIIVEGPDGAGKTTLVNRLLEEFPQLQLGERAVADRDKLYTVTRQDTHNALARAILASKDDRPRIWDRLFYSEFVYAPIVGRSVEFRPSETSWIQRIIEASRFPVILCLPPLDVVLENEAKAHQMEGVSENIGYIWEEYTKLWPKFFPPQTEVYNYAGKYADQDYQDVKRDIQDYLEEREERTW